MQSLPSEAVSATAADGFYFSVRSTRPDDVPAFSVGGGADVVEDGRADDVEADQGWEFVPDEAAWREELAEFIRRRGDHFMSC